jgi:UDP-N-acetylglucosamine 2-epimerase
MLAMVVRTLVLLERCLTFRSWTCRRSHFIITDSGGIQEEGTDAWQASLVLRGKNERPEAVDAGTVILVGTMRRAILGLRRLLDDAMSIPG